MRDGLRIIDEFVIEHGPFDGVFGFSLGAAMAIAYLLDQKRKEALPPWSFAIFFSPIFIASPDDRYCEELLKRWLGDDHAEFRVKFPDGDCVSLLKDAQERKYAEYLQLVLLIKSMGVGMILPNTTVNFLGAGNIEGVPRLVHYDLLPQRIKIPTVHVSGLRDSPYIREQSRVAQELCTSRVLRAHEHDGGHDIPFKRSDVHAIVRSIRAMAEEGQQIRDLKDF